MCFIIHHAKKIQGKVELNIHAFLNSVLAVCEWSASRYGSFNHTVKNRIFRIHIIFLCFINYHEMNACDIMEV